MGAPARRPPSSSKPSVSEPAAGAESGTRATTARLARKAILTEARDRGNGRWDMRHLVPPERATREEDLSRLLADGPGPGRNLGRGLATVLVFALALVAPPHDPVQRQART